ncbi:unnamed protein product [Ectocarpus sp. 13 AM-2016]
MFRAGQVSDSRDNEQTQCVPRLLDFLHARMLGVNGCATYFVFRRFVRSVGVSARYDTRTSGRAENPRHRSSDSFRPSWFCSSAKASLRARRRSFVGEEEGGCARFSQLALCSGGEGSGYVWLSLRAASCEGRGRGM